MRFTKALLAQSLLACSLIGNESLKVEGASGKGMVTEVVLDSKAESVIALYNSTLNGNNACYFVVIPATAQTFVYNDITGDWLGQGVFCSVTSSLEAGAVRLRIEFSKMWQGKRWLFITERNGVVTKAWSVAGEWEIAETQAEWIKPATRLQTKPLELSDARVRQDLDETQFWTVQAEDWGMAGVLMRNGVKQTVGEDYVWVGPGMFRTLAGIPWESDDLVTVIGLK